MDLLRQRKPAWDLHDHLDDKLAILEKRTAASLLSIARERLLDERKNAQVI